MDGGKVDALRTWGCYIRRNVASQIIGAQLIAKADGTPITSGTTTIYITGDGGTQGAGSVGGGACTHEGQGFWTYALAQSETNYAHAAYTFVNTNAINVTVQIYPIAYDASGQMTGVTVASGGIAAASFAAGAINAAAIADAAIDAATFAAGAINAAAIADGAIGAATFAAGAITATVIATGAIDADALAADTITAAKVAADVGTEISAAVWDMDATTHQTQGTFGQAIGDPVADTNTIYKAVVTDAAGANVAADIIGVKTETASIQGDTNDIQTRIPAALTGNGNMKCSLMEIIATALTETAGQIAAAFKQFFDVAAPTGTMKAITAVTTATNLTNLPSIPAGWITAAGVATGAIDADAIAADAATEIANAVWDTDATGHQTQGTFGQAIGDPVADANTIFKAVVTDATGATVGVDTAAIVADTNELQTDWANGGRLDLILDTAAAISPPSAATIADAVWNEAIGDHSGAGSTGLALAGASAPTAAAVADAVWDELIAGHAIAGSTGEALSNAGAAGVPPTAGEVADAVWNEAIADHLTAGSTGEALSDAGSAAATPADIADAVWDEVVNAGHATANSAAVELMKIPKSDGTVIFNVTCSSDIKSGLSTQAELNKVPKSDSNVTWNNTALASIQSECTDALNLYDGPTNAEMEARTLAAADYFDAVNDTVKLDIAYDLAKTASQFDPTTDPVTLANGAHGGAAATITAKSIALNNGDAGGIALDVQGTGAGNSHAVRLLSTNGKALAAGAAGNAVTIDSSAANGLVVTGATGDIVGDITGAVSSVGNIADAVWDEAVGDHAGAGSTGLALAGASAPSAGTVADAVWDEVLAGHAGAGSAGAALAGATAPTAAAVADAVWDEASGDHIGPGTTGTVLAAIPTAVDNADALLDRDMATGADNGTAAVRTPRQALRFLRNKWSVAGVTLTVTKEDDVTKSWEATLATTPGADPVTSNDPEGP